MLSHSFFLAIIKENNEVIGMVLGIIILIFFLGMLLAGILFYSKQKFINLEIFLKEAENNMDIVLEKKLELFRRLISHMKKKRSMLYILILKNAKI